VREIQLRTERKTQLLDITAAVREALAAHTLAECRALSEVALAAPDATAARVEVIGTSS